VNRFLVQNVKGQDHRTPKKLHENLTKMTDFSRNRGCGRS